jgi:uncharacterized protein (DUF2235 family)
MDAAGEHRWHRSKYPLQVHPQGSAQLSLATSLSEEADQSSLDRLPKGTQRTNDSALRHRSVIENRGRRYSIASQLGNDSDLSLDQCTEDIQSSDESSTPVSMSQRSTSPPSATRIHQLRSGGTEGTASSIQFPKNSQNADFQTSRPWTRNRYLLRATTDTSTEYHSPIPISIPEVKHEQIPIQLPKSDQKGAIERKLRRTSRSRRLNSPLPPVGGDEASPLVQLTENEQSIAVSGTNPWKRQVYPFQTTTSSVTMPKEELGLENRSRLGRLAENEEASTWSGSRDGRADPLQPSTRGPTSLASSPPLPDSESESVNQTSTYQPQIDNQAAKESKPWHRQAYPLQAPASNAALWNSLTPPPSPRREPEHISQVSAHQIRESDQAATRNKAFRRQIYPLQSPASIANLQGPPSPPSPSSTERGSQKEDEPSANQSREKETATKLANQWHRQSYPLQSPENVSPWERLPTPQPPEEEAEKEHKPRSIHLPKNVQAVNDAEKQDPKGRTIVVCLDGTGDKFDNDNSNIVHLVSALKKDDAHQVTYYQAGIGTYGAGGLSGGVSAALDMAVGSSLGLHVRDAYHFLMHTYKEGDKICIFSFSRGAYTARCLAGMIHKVGLLPPRNIQQISFAYEFYTNDTPEGWKQSNDFKKTFSIDVSVYFLGCFDSVASVGFIPRQLPLSSTPTNKCRYFRHAMALDERRAKFKICRHQTKAWDEVKKDASLIDAANKSARSKFSQFLPNYKAQDDAPPGQTPQTKHKQTSHPNLTDEEYERLTSHDAPFDTDVLEVWFAGAHADIGGGAVPNDERHKLAQIPLRWMIRQAFECNTGIIFKTAVLAEYGLDVHMLWPKYERLIPPVHGPPPSFLEKYEDGLPPRSIRRGNLVPIHRHEKGEHFYHLNCHTDEDWTPEQVEDFYDAMAPLNDQLVQAPNWWILELWPVQYKVPKAPGEVSIRTGMNLGRYRGVEDVEPNLHWTVQHRVQHTDYRIQARTAPHTTWRTVV